MRLIALLICLAIILFTPFHNHIRSLNGTEQYLKFTRGKLTFSNPWLIIAVLMAPPLLVFLLFYLLVDDLAYGLVGLLIDLTVLLLCLGAYEIKNDNSKIEEIFAVANENLFAILLWFILLGPFGALTYRFITSFRRLTESDPENFGSLADHLQFIHAILDWVPIRVTSFIYALAGDFMNTFGFWLTHAMRGIEANHELLCRSGLMALKIEAGKSLPDTEDARAEAQSLINTSIIICLGGVAIFTLGAWIS